jgi:chemotaxis protein methyltransferase CheR
MQGGHTLGGTLSQEDFTRLAAAVFQHSGISLGDAKRSMVEGRLRKRLRHLQMSSFQCYVAHVLSRQGGDEKLHMIECLTTHKTDFFREQHHFDYLEKTLLPAWVANPQTRDRTLRIWSAGCSTGEEAYSLAMLLLEWNQRAAPIRFEIHATDISRVVLKKAAQAYYNEVQVSGIPLDLRKKYLLRRVDDEQMLRVAPHVRKNVKFGLLNFNSAEFNLPGTFDIIFCRNVLIYFDRPTEERVINKLCRKLQTQGHLFLGHSESITGLNVPLETLGSTCYLHQP